MALTDITGGRLGGKEIPWHFIQKLVTLFPFDQFVLNNFYGPLCRYLFSYKDFKWEFDSLKTVLCPLWLCECCQPKFQSTQAKCLNKRANDSKLDYVESTICCIIDVMQVLTLLACSLVSFSYLVSSLGVWGLLVLCYWHLHKVFCAIIVRTNVMCKQYFLYLMLYICFSHIHGQCNLIAHILYNTITLDVRKTC